MGDTFLSDKITRERISPATTNLQREIRIVLQKLLESEGGGHYNFETQKITIGEDGLGRGVELACKDVQIGTDGTDLQVTIVDSANSDVDGDAQGFLIPTTVTGGPVCIKVDNVGRLRFKATAGKLVYILVRK